MKEQVPLECPICGNMIILYRRAHYLCAGCKAHFSLRFISHLRKQMLREIINLHFTTSKGPSTLVAIKDIEPVFPQTSTVQTLKKTTHGLHHTTKRLEELLGVKTALATKKTKVVRKKHVKKKTKPSRRNKRR